MRDQYDVIVIGGGLGGLTAAARLVHEGASVLLIEQHSVAGGCATTFRHKDLMIEVGLHEMDGFGGSNLKNKIFKELNVFNHVDFCEVPSLYRFINSQYDIEVPHGITAASETFKKFFPQEHASIDQYFTRLADHRKYRTVTGENPVNLGDYLDNISSCENLKLALCGNLMAFSDDPFNITMDYYAQAQASFYLSSGVFIKGGSQRLSDYLLSYIRSHGGEVLLNHLVNRINTSGNRITGVEYSLCKDRGTIKKVDASALVCNTSHKNAATLLADVHMANDVGKKEYGPSLFSLYLGFDKPLNSIANTAYCNCVFNDSIKVLRDIRTNNSGPYEQRHFVLTDYSHIDAQLSPSGKSVAVMVCVDYYDDWKALTSEAYNIKKKRVIQSFIDRINLTFPGVAGHIIYADAATPLSIERFTLNPSGSVYGYAQSPGNANINLQKSYENLYFASAWEKFGGGFSGAVYSGYFTALELLRKNRNAKSGN